MPKIILYNIQKVSTLSKFTFFLNHIQRTEPDIIALTEYDSKSTTSHQITSLLSDLDIHEIPAPLPSRVKLFTSEAFKANIITVNTIQRQFDHPYNQYVTDIQFQFEDHCPHLLLTYVPAMTHESSLTSLTTITKQAFMSYFLRTLSNITLETPIICGDWNLPENDPSLSSFFNRIECADAISKATQHAASLPTNHAPNGADRRLDRFYLSHNILNFHTLKYKVLSHIQGSTHSPVMLHIRPRSRRKQRQSDDTHCSFPTSLYCHRPSPFPNRLLDDQTVINAIFESTPIWRDNPVLTMHYYIKTINLRMYKMKLLMMQLPNPHKVNERVNRFREAHSGNPLCATYEQLNHRFKTKLAQTTFTNSVINEAHDLFSSIYQTPTEDSSNAIRNIFDRSFADYITSHISAEDQQRLHQSFTEEELFQNLQTLVKKGPSSPGPDGITYQAWYKGWEQAKGILTLFANHTMNSEHPLTPAHSIFDTLIKLIPKKGYKESPMASKLRPISLTNTIFRLINFSYTNRIMAIFNDIISPHQQAFLEGRDIHHNIQSTRILSHYIANQPASKHSLLLIDIEKAFDSLSHAFIPIVMQKFGLPTSFINSILYQSKTGKAQLLNGRFVFRKPIFMKRGVRQGLPISPLIFNLCLEPLIRRLNAQLKGIIYNPLQVPATSSYHCPLTTTCRVQAFADDLITFNSDVTDITTTLSILTSFHEISGLKINSTKTKVYCNGNQRDEIERLFPGELKIETIEENPIYLGVPILSTNWHTKLKLLVDRARRINFWDLPIHLRVLGMNTYVFSTIYFLEQHDPISMPLLDDFLVEIKRLLISRVEPKPSGYSHLWYIPRSQGGFGMMDLKTQLLGRRATYIQYALIPHSTPHPHPYLTTLMRLALQLRNFAPQYVHYYRQKLTDFVAVHIRDRITRPPPFIVNKSTTEVIQTGLTPWFLFRPVTDETTPGTAIHTELEATANYTITVNYSQAFRNHYRNDEIRQRNEAERAYLELLIVPPYMGPYAAPLDLQLPTDIHIQVSLPLNYHTYPNFQHYIEAWEKITSEPQIPTDRILPADLGKLMDNPVQLPGFSELSHLHLQPEFRQQTVEDLEESNPFRHLSKRLHAGRNYIPLITHTWESSHIPVQEWRRVFKQLASLIFHQPHHYYLIYALNVGMLNHRFFLPCPCGWNATEERMLHFVQHCPITKALWSFLHNSPPPKLIGPTLHDFATVRALNHFIGFLLYFHKRAYARDREMEPMIEWEDDDELQELHFHFSATIQNH
jgi:exonuclease III